MRTFITWVRRVWGASAKIERAANELRDLPRLIDDYRGVVSSMKSIRAEAANAWSDDHRISQAEWARISGRMDDLFVSYTAIDKELTEAIEATQAAVKAVLEG